MTLTDWVFLGGAKTSLHICSPPGVVNADVLVTSSWTCWWGWPPRCSSTQCRPCDASVLEALELWMVVMRRGRGMMHRIQLWYRELKRFSARKWQNLHNSPLSLSNSRLHENCAFLPIFWGENGTVILVGCNSPFCENCFSLRFRDFSKSRSNENYFSQTFSRLKENYFSQTFSRLKASSRKIKAWRLRLAARTARLTARTAPSNGPDGLSNGPDGPPNGPDGGAGDRRLRPD